MAQNLKQEFVYTFVDNNGDEDDYIIIKQFNINAQTYAAFAPCNEEDGDFLILKLAYENGERCFNVIDDDAEFDNASRVFEKAILKDMENAKNEGNVAGGNNGNNNSGKTRDNTGHAPPEHSNNQANNSSKFDDDNNDNYIDYELLVLQL